jgi:hypothetical protein
MKKYVRKDLISIESTNISFTMESYQNLKYLVQENQEKDDWIIELEEEVMHKKIDKGSLKEFKICVERFKIKLHDIETHMDVNIQVFQ